MLKVFIDLSHRGNFQIKPTALYKLELFIFLEKMLLYSLIYLIGDPPLHTMLPPSVLHGR